jgi:hypothetical protein
MAQIGPGLFVGTEARYLRSYEGLGLDNFAGHGFFVGPTIYAELSERSWILFAWNVQVWVALMVPSELPKSEPVKSVIPSGPTNRT